MKGKKLKYKDVFHEYKKDNVDIFVQKSLELRLWIAKNLGDAAPKKLKDFYRSYNEFIEFHQREPASSTPMPSGYNSKKNTTEKGYLRLEYFDLYDFLPKENFQQFKKQIMAYRRKNGQSQFSFFMSADDFERIDRLENFSDGQVFQNIITCKIEKNQSLSRYCTQVSIQMMSLSPTYLIVKYRFFTSRKFNDELNEIITKDYNGHFDIIRPAFMDWYHPWHCFYTFYDGNYERRKEVYDYLGRVKWLMYNEMQSNFKCYFGEEGEFPPCFETYKTNIRPSLTQPSDFWRSILIDESAMEYSMNLNMCVAWDFSPRNEPRKIQAIQGCGGDSFNGIMMSEISSEYAEYLVARTFNEVARKWMTICNRKIGKELKRAKSKSILKTRLKIEKRLYYSKRFITEFESDLKECGATKRFKPAVLHSNKGSFKRKSFTAIAFDSIGDCTQKTAKMIDDVIDHFDAVAENNNTYFGYRIAKYALWIAIITLIVTILFEIKNINWNELIKCVSDFISQGA